MFWKVFVLDGPATQEIEITPLEEIPQGYRIDETQSAYEKELWEDFWEYALDKEKAVSKGIKNVQVEAPGVRFFPGFLYTLRIEHDGGIRIDIEQIPEVLKGENFDFLSYKEFQATR